MAASSAQQSAPVIVSTPASAHAMSSQPGEPTHDLALPRRNLRDCLAEELRRLDPDDVYGAALTAVAQVSRPRKEAVAR